MEVIERIKELAKPHMSAFKTDLDHDGVWIESNPEAAFIHVTRESGTHIIRLPTDESLIDESPVPHLFGMARPGDIYKQQKELINGQLKESGRLWLLCENGVVKLSSNKRCLEIFQQRLRMAEARAKKSRLKCKVD